MKTILEMDLDRW